MLKNTLKIAWRKLYNHKTTTFTKIFSLSVGIISLFYISMNIISELKYDTFHSKLSNIYRVNTDIESPTGNLELALSATPVGAYLKSVVPEISEYTRVYKEYGSHAIKYGEKLFSESENIYFSDASFFKIFDFKSIHGNIPTALEGPDKMIITERTAIKYFGSADKAVDQIVLYDGTPFTITGVIQNIPVQSHLQFDFLVSMPTFYQNRPNADQNWSWFPMHTYVLLNDPKNIIGLQEKLKLVPQYLPENNLSTEHYSLNAEPLKGIHFGSTKLGELGAKGKMSNIYILFAIGIMILLLAISNYVNLTTAQISFQKKEVSVKKILGASKNGIFRQFMLESIFLTGISSLISVLVIFIINPYFENFVGTEIDLSFLKWPISILGILSVPIIIALIGGIYPAYTFSKIEGIQKEKMRLKSSMFFNIRTSLLIFQFTITSCLIIGSLMIYTQLNFIQSHDLGIDTKQKIVIEYGPNSTIGNNYEALKSELTQIQGVESATFSSHVPGQMPNGVSTVIRDQQGKTNNGEINLNLVDYDFVNNYGLKIIAGRDFRKGGADDTSSLILNEATVAAFGYNNPEDIIGASFEQWGGNGKVIGVVNNFNYLSLHEDVGLLSLKIWSQQFEKITLKIADSNIDVTIEKLSEKWASMFPNVPFKYYFVDENFKSQYVKDQKFSALINLFTFVSIVIGIIGLVAFATFWCEQKKKEMAIRKVLGASATLLILNFYKNFSLPILFSFIIAVPISFYLGNRWLQQFAYQFDFNWQFFVIPIFILLSFVLISVSTQTIRISISNPVDNLKEE